MGGERQGEKIVGICTVLNIYIFKYICEYIKGEKWLQLGCRASGWENCEFREVGGHCICRVLLRLIAVLLVRWGLLCPAQDLQKVGGP